jgi:hypothetical protein
MSRFVPPPPRHSVETADEHRDLRYRIAALETIVGVMARADKDQIAAEARQIIRTLGDKERDALLKDVHRITRTWPRER